MGEKKRPNGGPSEVQQNSSERTNVSDLSEIESLKTRVLELKEALGWSIKAIDRDRSGLAAALGEVIKYVQGMAWLTEGRGPYAFDDDRYREEAGRALFGMAKIAGDALRASGALADVEFKKAREVLGRMP